MTLTRKDAAGWHWARNGMFDGTVGTFGHFLVCREQPRLRRLNTYSRKTGELVSVALTVDGRPVPTKRRDDGMDVPDFDAALAMLNKPFDVDEEERVFLRALADTEGDKKAAAQICMQHGQAYANALGKSLIIRHAGTLLLSESGLAAIDGPPVGSLL